MSLTFLNVLPPSVESATRTSPLVLTRYVIQRFPKRSQASCWSQQISPSGSPAPPITRRVHVWPSSKETPTASPATTSGSVAIATTFEGSVGLTAIASSASLPGMAVTLKFGAGAAAVASVAVARAPAKASTIIEDVLVRNWPRILSPPSGDPVRRDRTPRPTLESTRGPSAAVARSGSRGAAPDGGGASRTGQDSIAHGY